MDNVSENEISLNEQLINARDVNRLYVAAHWVAEIGAVSGLAAVAATLDSSATLYCLAPAAIFILANGAQIRSRTIKLRDQNRLMDKATPIPQDLLE